MKATFLNSWRFLLDDYRERPWFLLIETVSTLLGMAAAIHLALANKDANFYFVWGAYCISSLGLTFVGYKRKSTNIMILMIVYTIINIIGLINTF